ncbi:alpha/beta fold hydrolase [Collinsella tanakaei]|nr:alpha/beta fold hydrolase [Collinsella tanakaei]
MAQLASYYVPDLYVEDHSIDVPLDWRGLEPALLAMGMTMRVGAFPAEIPGAPESIKLFYRVVCAPEHVNDDLPLLVFFQGGPGGACPRPLSPTSDGWIAEAVKHYRVVLPDQRGTGRSSRVSGQTMAELARRAQASGADPARTQADFLKRFLAPSIVRDFEYLRLTQFGGKLWTTLGQSYGGFITLAYLSSYPTGITASFTCGGIPHVPASAAEVYEHTFPRMAAKTRQYYERYPDDVERVAAVADIVAAGDVALPDGSPLTVERLQLLGSDFGMKPSFERMHWLFDTAFEQGDGTVGSEPVLSDGFLMGVLDRTTTRANPLYWTLQELIYADGTCAPIRWAAAAEKGKRAEFDADARPLMFTGEACFPWMFEDMPELKPFADAVGLLMEDIEFDPVYNPVRLAQNEVPLHAAVYFDDMYVDSGLQLDTLSRVGNAHPWVTNEFEHDGLHGDRVFRHLYEEARDAGHLHGRMR